MKRRGSYGPRAPSITAPFADARAVLGVEVDAEQTAIKRAYRRLVAEHPPDRDPDGFRKVRDAYDMLTNPLERAEAILADPTPRVALSPVTEAEVPAKGELALVVLRAWAAELDAGTLFGEEPL